MHNICSNNVAKGKKILHLKRKEMKSVYILRTVGLFSEFPTLTSVRLRGDKLQEYTPAIIKPTTSSTFIAFKDTEFRFNTDEGKTVDPPNASSSSDWLERLCSEAPPTLADCDCSLPNGFVPPQPDVHLQLLHLLMTLLIINHHLSCG